MVLYICEGFPKISRTVFNLHSGHEYILEMAMFNVQRAITPKVDDQRYGSSVLHVVSWCFIFV